MGARNEDARTRRRQEAKEQLSLRSFPGSELDDEAAPSLPKGTLSNHFFWAVMEDSQGDERVFPHQSQYHDKPDIYGRDSVKEIYVLSTGKAGQVENKTTPKATQTSFIGHKPRITWLPDKLKQSIEDEKQFTVVKDVVTREVFEESDDGKSNESLVKKSKSEEIIRRKKKRSGKLISDFFYKRKDSSRSPHKTGQEKNLKSGGSDIENNLPHGTSETEDNTQETAEISTENKYSKSDKSTRKPDVKGSKQDKWKLRAGAETGSRIFDSKSNIIRQKNLKFESARHWRASSSERLLKTPSGSNRYLYVTNRNKRSVECSDGNL